MNIEYETIKAIEELESSLESIDSDLDEVSKQDDTSREERWRLAKIRNAVRGLLEELEDFRWNLS